MYEAGRTCPASCEGRCCAVACRTAAISPAQRGCPSLLGAQPSGSGASISAFSPRRSRPPLVPQQEPALQGGGAGGYIWNHRTSSPLLQTDYSTPASAASPAKLVQPEPDSLSPGDHRAGRWQLSSYRNTWVACHSSACRLGSLPGSLGSTASLAPAS
jgi:hypothetical protein